MVFLLVYVFVIVTGCIHLVLWQGPGDCTANEGRLKWYIMASIEQSFFFFRFNLATRMTLKDVT
jgi:hypothetical protein